MIKRWVFILSIAVLGYSCSKPPVESPKTLNAEDYFPMDTGMYWIYDVLKIEIDAPIDKFDTTVFEIKMLIKTFDEDLQHYEYWRFSRADSTMPWENYDIVTVNADELTIQWVENNLRYVKLTQPIIENKNWDGNIYNILAPWNYNYTDLESSFENEFLSINNTIKVNQRNQVNILQSERAWEIYGKDVGLVYKYEEVLVLEANQPKTGTIEEFNLKFYKK